MRNDNLTIPQGTSWGYRWPIVDNEGQPMYVEGWTAKAQARPYHASDEVLHEWSTEAETITVANSSVTLHVAPSVSSAWSWTTAVFDIELTDLDGNVARIAEGRFTVSPEVTR